MPKPTRAILLEQTAFERRQNVYEKRYQRQIFTYLRQTYFKIANAVEKGENWNISIEPILKVYNKMYTDVILVEAKMEWEKTVVPYLPKKKDIIDDLVRGITGLTDGNVFQIWRELLQQFIQVRTTGRIQRITETTQRKITKIISDGIANGQGNEVIARTIRKEAGAEFNKNRALAIARTEVVTSMNQAKYLSAESSPYVMEKRWSPVFQPKRTRESHIEFFNSDYIPLETEFTVGIYENGNRVGEEQALYPGDLKLSAGNVINCRCSLVTRPMKNANGGLIRRNNFI